MSIQDQLVRHADRQRPAERPDETYASTLTSVDTKLAYNEDQDRFEAFIIGDINANPEGIQPLSEGNSYLNMDGLGELYDGKRLKDVVADGYLHNAQQVAENGAIEAAVIMHPATYDDGWKGNSWLVADKQTSVGAIEDHEAVENVYPVLPDGDITVKDGDLYVDGNQVDGYANVYDQGDALLRQFAEETEDGALVADGDHLYAHGKGSNGATAVWARDAPVRQWSAKLGQIATAHELSDAVDGVHVAEYETVETIYDAVDAAEDGKTVYKAELSTWGDSVVPLETNDVETALRKFASVENTVRQRGDRRNDFHLVDDEGRFVETPIGNANANGDVTYAPAAGIMEEAITGTVERNGDEYTIFDVDGQPVDFVPLATYDPETGKPEVYGITVRSSSKTSLNANCGGKNFSVQELDQALEKGVLTPDQQNNMVAYDLQEELEELAGRDIEEWEIREPLENAGYTAWTTRNVSAYRAEEQLEG